MGWRVQRRSALCWWIAIHVALVHGRTRWDLPCDVNRHGPAFPMPDQLLLAEMPPNGLLRHLVAGEFHPLCLWSQTPLSPHPTFSSAGANPCPLAMCTAADHIH